MQHPDPHFYAPYESEAESEAESAAQRKAISGSDSDSDDSDSSTSTGNSIARGLDDPRYAILKLAGPPLDTPTSQLFYEHGPPLIGSVYEPMPAMDASNNVIEYKSPLPPTSACLPHAAHFTYKSDFFVSFPFIKNT